MGSIRFVLCRGHGIDTNIPCNRCNSCPGLLFNISYRYSRTVYLMAGDPWSLLKCARVGRDLGSVQAQLVLLR